jgi:pilus assembly protein CpaE
MTIKVSVVCASEDGLDALNQPHASLEDSVVAVQTGSVRTLAEMMQRDQPDVVLLDLPESDTPAMDQIELAMTESPGTHMVVVSSNRTAEFLMRAMRAGVREVLPAPISAATVQAAVQSAKGHAAFGARQRTSTGRVIAVIPAKGGAGATFLATNLAFALSKQKKRVAVIDLNLYFGDASLFLGDRIAVSSVADLSRQTYYLDAALLDASMVKVNDNLHVLPAPESPEEVHDVSSSGLEKIVNLARNQYDFVILDLSGALDPVAVKALDLSDSIYLTLQLNLPFLRAAKRMASVFRGLGYPKEKLNLVINRFEKRGEISLSDVEKSTLLRVTRTIPNSHDACTASVNQGVPMLELLPQDSVSRALRDWAQELAPLPPQRSSNWLRDLLARTQNPAP